MNLKERIQLSRKLSYILRHKAQTLGIKIRTDGYVSLDELVNYLKVTINDINDVVDNDLKKRYTITTIDNNIYIRANQGHSMENIELNLKEIHSANELPICMTEHISKYFKKSFPENIMKVLKTILLIFPKKNGINVLKSCIVRVHKICILKLVCQKYL